jgi:predicted PurR-regulated permease PerM
LSNALPPREPAETDTVRFASARPDPVRLDPVRLFRQAMVILAAIALAVIAWQLTQLLMLVFASTLVALMFSGFAGILQRRLRLPFGLALAVAVLLPLTALVIIFGVFGNLMVDQFSLLADQLPAAVRSGEQWLRGSEMGREALGAVRNYAPEVGTVVGFAQSTLANFGSAASALAVVLVGGIYLAAQPGLYIGGFKALLGPDDRARADRILGSLRVSLIAWLRAQAVGMAFVAVGTSVGLSIVGLPSAVAIGLVAGLCEFVPYLGVILVSVPAVAIGFSMGVQTGIFTVIALVVVQQLQGNVVTPMAQGQFGDLPPALTIFSLLAAAALAGPIGVVLAVPLTVVAMVMVKAMAGLDLPSAPAPTARR